MLAADGVGHLPLNSVMFSENCKNPDECKGLCEVSVFRSLEKDTNFILSDRPKQETNSIHFFFFFTFIENINKFPIFAN